MVVASIRMFATFSVVTDRIHVLVTFSVVADSFRVLVTFSVVAASICLLVIFSVALVDGIRVLVAVVDGTREWRGSSGNID